MRREPQTVTRRYRSALF